MNLMSLMTEALWLFCSHHLHILFFIKKTVYHTWSKKEKIYAKSKYCYPWVFSGAVIISKKLFACRVDSTSSCQGIVMVNGRGYTWAVFCFSTDISVAKATSSIMDTTLTVAAGKCWKKVDYGIIDFICDRVYMYLGKKANEKVSSSSWEPRYNLNVGGACLMLQPIKSKSCTCSNDLISLALFYYILEV